MQETVKRFSGHLQQSCAIERVDDVHTPSQDVPSFPLACDTISWSAVCTESDYLRQKFPSSLCGGDTLRLHVARMFQPGVVETMEVVKSAKIAGYLTPSLQAMRVHTDVPGLCAGVNTANPRYITDIYATAQYGPSQSRRYSTVGYKVLEQDGKDYVKFGKCALLFPNLT